MLYRIACTLLLLTLLASCASDIDFKMPVNQFQTPETTGKLWKGYAEANYSTSHKITLSEVYQNAIFDIQTVDTKAKIERSKSFGLNAALGVWKRVDVIYQVNHDSPNRYGLKFQFLGKPENKKEKGHKMAVAAAYGWSTKSEGSLSFSHDGSERSFDSEIKIKTFNYNFLYGYRGTKNVIYYLDLFYSTYDTEASLISSEHGNQKITGMAKNYGALAGIKLNSDDSKKYLKFEFGYTKGEWKNELTKDYIPAGLAVGFTW